MRRVTSTLVGIILSLAMVAPALAFSPIDNYPGRGTLASSRRVEAAARSAYQLRHSIAVRRSIYSRLASPMLPHRLTTAGMVMLGRDNSDLRMRPTKRSIHLSWYTNHNCNPATSKNCQLD